MFETTKIHLCADSKDLNCPICYCAFSLEENQPISINCGHTLCSICFEKVSKCPFCKVRFHKRRQKHNKSVFISSLIANSTKVNTCKEHSEVCQGFCLQDKAFVCFDCVMKNHQSHKIILIKEIQEKAEKTRAVLQKARKARDSKQLELKNSLEAESKNQKRQLDEIIDQEISHLSMLKKKLYKEVDIRMMSEKEHYEHQLLSANLSKYCKSTETMLEGWNKNQEISLAVQILDAPLVEEAQGIQSYENKVDLFKTEITKKHVQSMNEVLKSLNAITHSSAKFKKLFAPNKKIDPTQNFPQVELDYLINVFQEYNLTASQKNGCLELKVNNNTTAFTPKFDPNHFICSLSKISLSCLDILPSPTFATISQVVQNIQALKGITLHLQKMNNPDLFILFNLISNSKTLEKFNVQMDLTDVSIFDIRIFMRNLTSLKNLFSLDIQRKNPHSLISFQLVHSSIPVLPFTTLQEITLDLECTPEVSEAFHTLNASQAKSLRAFKLSLGKAACNPQVLEAVCQTLRLQSDLQELVFTCEELSEGTSSDLSKLLAASTQRKKLEIFVNKVLIRDSPTKFLPKAHPSLQDLEEFTFKIKYDRYLVVCDDFTGLVDFLSSMKALKKLCLQFDGVNAIFRSNLRLFAEITKLQTLLSLEIEYIDRYGLPNSEQRAFGNILNRLPSSVNKKWVFKRSDYRPYEDDGWDEDSEYSRYSDEDDDYLQENDDYEEVYG